MHGSQIHKGTLSARGAARTKFPPGSVVAVKVRHPGVSVIMERDFALMQRAALLSKQLPLLSQLNLEVRSGTMGKRSVGVQCNTRLISPLLSAFWSVGGLQHRRSSVFLVFA
jgi:ABC1 atypical kinase-like domain